MPVPVLGLGERRVRAIATGFAHTGIIVTPPVSVNEAPLTVAGHRKRAAGPQLVVQSSQRKHMANDAAEIAHMFRTAYEDSIGNRNVANILVSGISGAGKEQKKK